MAGKRIAVFCDGTWLSDGAEHPSNVVRLAQAVLPRDPDGVTQVTLYFAGLGASGRDRFLDRNGAGAFGWGIDKAIEDVYRTLVFAYEPGDEIYLFGYSRGATTVRSLTGLIGQAGMLPKSAARLIPEAMRRYRRGIKGQSAEAFAWRAQHAPNTATSIDEVEWRKAEGLTLPDEIVRIAYLGVWDTVGALGVPNHYGVARLFNGRYQFHDLKLSPLVRRARQALAIDERRLAFAPAPWEDLPGENRKILGHPEGFDLRTVPPERRPYRQEWFPGDHGAVGGGHRSRGLSSYAMDWIAEGAALDTTADPPRPGLAFDQAQLVANRGECDALAGTSTLGEGVLSRLWRLADRDGPDDPGDVSEAARLRLRGVPDWAPGTLGRVMERLRAARPG